MIPIGTWANLTLEPSVRSQYVVGLSKALVTFPVLSLGPRHFDLFGYYSCFRLFAVSSSQICCDCATATCFLPSLPECARHQSLPPPNCRSEYSTPGRLRDSTRREPGLRPCCGTELAVCPTCRLSLSISRTSSRSGP